MGTLRLRLGAKQVYIIYRRTEVEMPARKEKSKMPWKRASSSNS